MAFQKRDFPEGVIYARVDQLTTYQDYRPYDLCLRLIGVDKRSFEKAAFNEDHGCETFLIDLNLKHGSGVAAISRLWSGISGSDFQIRMFLENAFAINSGTEWLEVKFNLTVNGSSDSYGYALFQDAAPTYLDIQSIQPVAGPALTPLTAASASQPISREAPSSSKQLLAFHVGQGMCSVLQCDNVSYLLDAGAGTPVKREAYESKRHSHLGALTNELVPALAAEVHMVLSHPDSDHWRLLDWDSTILSRIKEIFVPDNVADIVLSDKTIKPKLVPTNHLEVRDPTGSLILEARRSQPTAPDKNGECLVAIASVAGKQALLPGDYAYKRMVQDLATTVNAMQKKKFDAVVVPHHGDRLSALAVVGPTVPHKSIAFFSAGNHLGYHHPRAESLMEHHNMHFEVISKKWVDDIIAVKLL